MPPKAPMWPVRIRNHAHSIMAMPDEARDGRNLRQGYLRACGIQLGNIRELAMADPLFAACFGAAQGRTVVTHDNLCNLFLLIRFYLGDLAPGHIAEFGSYRGGSAIFMAMAAKEIHPGTKVFAFDTFEGMPPSDAARDAHRQGDFADANLGEIEAAAAALGLDNLVLVKGRFETTAPRLLAEHGPIRLAHIDCDIYEAVAAAYDLARPHMVPGGYLVFDDPLASGCIGAFEAVERLLVRRDGLYAEQTFPHLVYRYPPLPDGPAPRGG